MTTLGTTHIKRAGARSGRGVPPQVARRRAQVRGRDRRCAGAVRGRRRGDARRLAGRLLARDQPADPERGRAAARPLGHAVRDHRRRPPLAAAALVLPTDLEFLVGIYAFGALLAFTIAHVSVIALRFREPDRDRPYRVPLSITVSGREVPVPAVVGARRVGARLGRVARLPRGRPLRRVGWLLGRAGCCTSATASPSRSRCSGA